MFHPRNMLVISCSSRYFLATLGIVWVTNLNFFFSGCFIFAEGFLLLLLMRKSFLFLNVFKLFEGNLLFKPFLIKVVWKALKIFTFAFLLSFALSLTNFFIMVRELLFSALKSFTFSPSSSSEKTNFFIIKGVIEAWLETLFPLRFLIRVIILSFLNTVLRLFTIRV